MSTSKETPELEAEVERHDITIECADGQGLCGRRYEAVRREGARPRGAVLVASSQFQPAGAL